MASAARMSRQNPLRKRFFRARDPSAASPSVPTNHLDVNRLSVQRAGFACDSGYAYLASTADFQRQARLTSTGSEILYNFMGAGVFLFRPGRPRPEQSVPLTPDARTASAPRPPAPGRVRNGDELATFPPTVAGHICSSPSYMQHRPERAWRRTRGFLWRDVIVSGIMSESRLRYSHLQRSAYHLVLF